MILDINLIWANVISQTIANIPIYIVILVVYLLGKRLILNIPKYLEQYDAIKMKHYQINKAKGIR